MSKAFGGSVAILITWKLETCEDIYYNFKIKNQNMFYIHERYVGWNSVFSNFHFLVNFKSYYFLFLNANLKLFFLNLKNVLLLGFPQNFY